MIFTHSAFSVRSVHLWPSQANKNQVNVSNKHLSSSALRALAVFRCSESSDMLKL